jgi:hypothetical protein
MDYISVSKVTVDPRLDCLVLLTEHFSNRCSSESLTAGLPLNSVNITLDLLPKLLQGLVLQQNCHVKTLTKRYFSTMSGI